MNIKREGGPEDPVEGSNVTLICYFRGDEYPYSPNWFYFNSSTADYRQLNSANTNFKNDKKLNEFVKISEQPNKGFLKNLHYDKIYLDSFFVLLKCMQIFRS